MNIERPGSPSATTVAPTSKRRSTSIETSRSRLASERPPKKGVASRNAFRSGETTVIDQIYSRRFWRQARDAGGTCPLKTASFMHSIRSHTTLRQVELRQIELRQVDLR